MENIEEPIPNPKDSELPKKEAAPAGELKFLSREELAEVLKKQKERGSFEDPGEETAARASAVLWLREGRDVLWKKERQGSIEQQKRIEDLAFDNLELEKKHFSQLYRLLTDPKVDEPELNRIIDYLAVLEGEGELAELTVINEIAWGSYPYSARRLALERLLSKIQGLEGKIEEREVADQLVFSLPRFMEVGGKDLNEEQREELREKALSQLVSLAEGKDKYLRNSAAESLVRLALGGDKKVFSRVSELLGRNAENSEILEDFAWSIKYRVEASPEFVKYVQLLVPYLDRHKELYGHNRGASAFKSLIFEDTFGGKNLFSYLKEQLGSGAKNADELWQELAQGEERERLKKEAEQRLLSEEAKLKEEERRLREEAELEAEKLNRASGKGLDF